MRDTLHRWAVAGSVILALTGAAIRRSRRARYRRRILRSMDAWPW